MNSTTVKVIDLLSDDDEDVAVCSNNNKRRASAPASMNTNERRVVAKHAHGGADVANNNDDDDEVQVVDGMDASSQAKLKTSTAASSNNDDDDVCLVGSTGHNALEDFPHSRESCVKHPFRENPFLYCGQCYCFVCDVLASKCPCWRQHCHASYGQAKWRKMREDKKPKMSAGQQSQAAAARARPRPQAARNMPASRAARFPVQHLPRHLQSSIEILNQMLHQQELLRRQRLPSTPARRPSRAISTTPAARRQPRSTTQPLARQSTTNDNSTIYLNMSAEEQRSFGYSSAPSGILDPFMNGGSLSDVQQSLLLRPTQVSSIANSKVNALCTDLNVLRRTEPSMKAIVYTHYQEMQDTVVGTLCRLGYSVFDFIGCSTSTKARNDRIRKFDLYRGNKPAVCVILLQGDGEEVLLSSPTHVFLMEPCLDPAVELRIKRVHQQGGRSLQVKRFVFRYSVEANIAELHEEIAAGRISIPESKVLPPRAIQILAKGIRRSTDYSYTAPILLEV